MFAAHNLPDGIEPSLDSDASYDPENFSFPHGTHLCAVDVDTETGMVKIRKYVCVDDIGTPINPLIIEGQVHGGLAQGIAQALFEEAIFDDARQPHHRHLRRLHPAVGGRPAVVHHRPHRHPGDVQSAGRQGCRRGRHDRLDPGRDQRGDRRAAAARRQGRPNAGDAGASLASDSGGAEVIPAAFDYVRPSSVAEAVSALGAAGEDGKILAGGQSLIPVLRLRLAYPSTLVDIGRIPELKGVRDDGDAIVIGAMTTHHEVMHDPLVVQHAPLIAQATATVADPQVRHRGTFGGALSHGDPAGDLGAVAVALGCEFVASGPVRRTSHRGVGLLRRLPDDVAVGR